MCLDALSACNKRGRTCLMDYCVLFACLIAMTSATIMGDECDWTGSGLTNPLPNRGVTPVYLRCTAGRISWLYPRGALRVLLRLPDTSRDFRACVRVRRSHARLFLEGPRSLLPLYADGDGPPKAVRCFNSKNGQVAIYVEAIDGDSVEKHVAEFDYDLQPFPRGVHGFDKNEECRPCNDDELAHAFCTSDLVTRGTIHGVEIDDDLDVSEMSVRITKLIRHTGDDEDIEVETNEVDVDGDRHATIHVARRCGVSHGIGEFVFMARRKLGYLTLRCAPRLEDWAGLIHRLTEQGRAHCLLRS